MAGPLAPLTQVACGDLISPPIEMPARHPDAGSALLRARSRAHPGPRLAALGCHRAAGAGPWRCALPARCFSRRNLACLCCTPPLPGRLLHGGSRRPASGGRTPPTALGGGQRDLAGAVEAAWELEGPHLVSAAVAR